MSEVSTVGFKGEVKVLKNSVLCFRSRTNGIILTILEFGDEQLLRIRDSGDNY